MLLAALPLIGFADHHPPDQSAPVPDDQMGGDDVPAGGQPHVAGLRPAAAMADHGDADGGDRRLGLRGQPSAGRRLAGSDGRAAAPTPRSSCSTVRPACSRLVPTRAARSSRRVSVSWSATLETLGSSRWVLIESTTHKPRELESVDRPAQIGQHGPGQRLGRCAGDAAGRPRLHQGQQGGPHRDLDLLGHPRKRLERRQRPLAGAARWLSRISAGRAVPSAGLSSERRRQPVGACDRCSPAEDRRRRRALDLVATGAGR